MTILNLDKEDGRSTAKDLTEYKLEAMTTELRRKAMIEGKYAEVIISLIDMGYTLDAIRTFVKPDIDFAKQLERRQS